MPLTSDELEPLLRLALVPGIGPLRLRQLIQRFGSAGETIRAPARGLREVPGLGGQLVARIARASGSGALLEAQRALRRLDRVGAVALLPDDPAYPEAFRDVPDPPFPLFAAGNLELLGTPCLAVVGTRAPTGYGRGVCAGLGQELARSGFTIVSGMARGVDSIAHQAALDAGGATIGVLGHGIEQVYPPENRALFRAVRERGLLLSEFLPGETPRAGNFPRRNRLITALSTAVLVVEMGHRSGAQHTVSFALEQGKEVLAVPGPIGSPASAGTNQLIRDGARLVTCARDVVEELRGVGAVVEGAAGPAPGAPAQPQLALLPLLTGVEERVLASLASGPRHVDELSLEADLAPGAALAVLLELELRGLVVAAAGKVYTRT
jgi:DNA processing protein